MTTPLFNVNRREDWRPVVLHLMKAFAHPLKGDEGKEFDTTDLDEFLDRVKVAIAAGRGDELTQDSALVLYHQRIIISLLMTVDEQHVHVSAARLLPPEVADQPASVIAMSDELAKEIGDEILGTSHQRGDARTLPHVRHFFFQKT
jgi:hypothetical protein